MFFWEIAPCQFNPCGGTSPQYLNMNSCRTTTGAKKLSLFQTNIITQFPYMVFRRVSFFKVRTSANGANIPLQLLYYFIVCSCLYGKMKSTCERMKVTWEGFSTLWIINEEKILQVSVNEKSHWTCFSTTFHWFLYTSINSTSTTTIILLHTLEY